MKNVKKVTKHKKLKVVVGLVLAAIVIMSVAIGVSTEKNETLISKEQLKVITDTEKKDETTTDDVEEKDNAENIMVFGNGEIFGGDNGPVEEWENLSQDVHIIQFPYTIPNSNVVIQKITGYSGVFVENGADTETVNTAAAIISNNNSSSVEFVNVTLECNGEILNFQASDIPSGATVVAMENNQSEFINGTYYNCQADIAWLDELDMSESQVKVEENEEGYLEVTNISDDDIPCIRIFYKYYMKEENMFVGGITYTVKVNELKKGKMVTVTPTHYVPGASKVVMIRTYSSESE